MGFDVKLPIMKLHRRTTVASEVERPENPTHVIILVDPFRDARFHRHSTTLQKKVVLAVEEINAQPQTSVRLSLDYFNFSISDVVVSRADLIERAARKLRVQLDRMIKDRETMSQSDSKSPRPFIFVTHSLGLLVVDKALPDLETSINLMRSATFLLVDAAPYGRFDDDYLVHLSKNLGVKRPLGPAQSITQIRLTPANSKNMDAWLAPSWEDKINNASSRRGSIKSILRRNNHKYDAEVIEENAIVSCLRELARGTLPASPPLPRLKGNLIDDQRSTCKCAPHPAHPSTANEHAYLSMAKAFWTGGELLNAQRLLQSLLTANTDTRGSARNACLDLEVRLEMGSLFIDMGRIKEADQILLQLEKVAHSSSCIQNIRLGRLRASLHASQGQYGEAISRLEDIRARVGTDRTIQVIHLHQDLAHISGMMGRYDQAMSHVNHSKKLLELADSSVDSSEHMTLSLKTLYTSAFLDVLQGNYVDGYNRSSSVLEKCRHAHGAKSLSALRSSVLCVSFLVHLGQFDKAVALCTDIMRTTEQRLGRGHPLHLEATCILVRVLQATWRLPEALATAKSLLAVATESLAPSHPMILETCGELSTVYLALGMFHCASRVSESVLGEDFGVSQFPEREGLRHLAKHAEILHYCGESQKALQVATRTLQKQWHQFIKSNGGDDHNGIPAIFDAIVRAQSRAHLDLFTTLHIIAIVKLRTRGDARQSVYILRRALQLRTMLLGSEHPVTIQTGHDLASALCSCENQSGQELDEATETFQRVWESRCHLFGPGHPITLVSERAVIQTRCKRGSWETGGPGRRLFPNVEKRGEAYHNQDDGFLGEPHSTPGTSSYLNISLRDLQDALKVSQCIFLQQEELLSARHSETLTTMRWLLTIQIHLYGATNFRTTSMWQRLRAQLHDDETRRERLVWSLRMEHSVAITFNMVGQEDTARAIWRDIRLTITGVLGEMPAGRSGGEATIRTAGSGFATPFSTVAALGVVWTEINDALARDGRSGSDSQCDRAGCHESDTFRDSGIFM